MKRIKKLKKKRKTKVVAIRVKEQKLKIKKFNLKKLKLTLIPSNNKINLDKIITTPLKYFPLKSTEHTSSPT